MTHEHFVLFSIHSFCIDIRLYPVGFVEGIVDNFKRNTGNPNNIHLIKIENEEHTNQLLKNESKGCKH